MIAITDKGELIPVKRGQSFTGFGFLGIIITNPEDLANDEYGAIGCRFSQPDSEKLRSEIQQVLHKYQAPLSDHSSNNKDGGRKLVVKRHSRLKSRLVLCDEQTGQPLEGQTSMLVESHEDITPKITVTFDAWGAHGVRFEDEPRSK